MNYRLLGRTGLQVSELGLGTVSLGVDYGIPAPNDFGRPDCEDAIRLLHHAADQGINLFDTAPAYGESERLLGQALGKRTHCVLATKVAVPRDADGRPLRGRGLAAAVRESLERSLRPLRRETLDLVQIHNATLDVVLEGEMAEVLQMAQTAGKIRWIGASVYSEREALAVIEAGCFAAVQVAYNLLDQRMSERVFPAATAAGVAVVTRSPYLKGVLTPKAQWLPDTLRDLRFAVDRACETLASSWDEMPAVALRYCLAAPQIASVLIGPRTISELDHALAAAAQGPLPPECARRARALALRDERLLNPATWPIP